MNFTRTSTHELWLRLVFFILIIATAVIFLFLSDPATSEAAQTVTLNPGTKLTVLGSECVLAISTANANKVKVNCTGYTPTPTNTPTETATATATATPTETATPTGTPSGEIILAADSSLDAVELALAPDAKRTLAAGKSLKVVPNGCKLQVKKDSPAKVVVFCKALPTLTPTVTRTPTQPKATLIPPQDGVWLGVTDENVYVYFEVTGGGKYVSNFETRFRAPMCSPYFSNHGNTVINDNRFEIKITFSGQGVPSIVKGNFTPTQATGTYDIYAVTGSVCGPYDKAGSWSATKQ